MAHQRSNESAKWLIGAVLVPIGLSLAVSGVSVASFKGAQEVKNSTFEKEILESKRHLSAEMKEIKDSMDKIISSQQIVQEKQIELVIKAELREKEMTRLYSEFKGVRDSVLLMQQNDE